jgi:hypothetical protein
MSAQTMEARDIWRTFTGKTVDKKIQVEAVWPFWRYAGPMSKLYYLSDKWDGQWRPYYHKTTCHLWLPGKGGRAPRPRPGPDRRPTRGASILAYSLGWDMKNGEKRAQTTFGDLLCGFTSHRKTYLYVLDARGQVIALFEGDRLKITPEGIVG